MELRVGEANLHFADGLMYRRESAADVLLKFVVQRDRSGEPAHGLISHGLGAAFSFEHILDHLDRGAEANAAGGLGQCTKEVEENVEVRWQEGVKVRKARLAEVRVVVLGVLQLGVLPKRLALRIEELAECGLASRRLAKQAAVADLLDVARFEVDLDR